MRGVLLATTPSEAIRERLVVFGAQHATASLACVLLDDVMSNLVHQYVEENEVMECVIGPVDHGL
jgi:hypothetical protein